MNWRFAVTHAYKERRGWGRVRERAGEGGKKKRRGRPGQKERKREKKQERMYGLRGALLQEGGDK